MRKKYLLFSFFLVSLCLSLNFVVLAAASNADTIVYVTNTGAKYHRRGCHYLKSINEFTLEQAVSNGKTPCSYCDPPIPNFDYAVSEGGVDRLDNGSQSHNGSSPTSTYNSYPPNNSFAAVVLFLFLSALPPAFLFFLVKRRNNDHTVKTSSVSASVKLSPVQTQEVTQSPVLYCFNEDEFAFVNAFRYARYPLETTAIEFNRKFKTYLSTSDVKTAYHRALSNYQYGCPHFRPTVFIIIHSLLDCGFSWKEITVYINYHYKTCYGPKALKAEYIREYAPQLHDKQSGCLTTQSSEDMYKQRLNDALNEYYINNSK